MIIAPLKELNLYACLHHRLEQLSIYLSSENFIPPNEKVIIDGDNLFINVAKTNLKQDIQPLEVHRKYIDVHIPITASETLGWASLQALEEKGITSDFPFNDSDDYTLYSVQPQITFTINPGQCCIFFPDDVHVPLLGEGEIHKLIAKVLI